MTSATLDSVLDSIFPFAGQTLSARPVISVVVPRTIEREQAIPTPSRTQSPSLDQKAQDLDDEGLLFAICDGAEWAMDVLYQRYYKYAYALAYRIVHDSAIAEDIVQDSFLAVWRKAASYQEQQGSVRSWLQAIVHHRAIDKLRASAHRDAQWVPLQVENEQDPPSTQPEVWEEAWRHEQAVLIRRVLAQLPPAQRQVIELAYFGGYTHAEIAERWDIPLGTVKGRMRLGLQKMKQLLHEQGVETTY
jgi:RNA polymerase sigma-70 factor, ECF subfamily